MFYSAVVTVSVPAMMSVGEGDGMVEVCVILSAINGTERNVTITLATGEDTGMQTHAGKIAQGGWTS
jgi:hypothetical protein